MIHQKILKYLAGRDKATTADIYRYMRLDRDKVLDELGRLVRDKQIESEIHFTHGGTGTPYAVWWLAGKKG